ncbi:Crp/Fnr family transcriptional regulator [Faecalibacter rhinopitheci]|uniref:Crp/Fnr family transcriptional regulator n=1 Tax=Faecalibacter rhinopitheci TaxID=2779678 RepID=A0A8J7G4U5_9FLAO|nr:Crp/Fnr family transcriptional regulator [Faecalibacter rhinopitheci]MBF0596315.1 Crp/Fnr family transcriptional regulator [Faecalibacter rhinopitheci]
MYSFREIIQEYYPLSETAFQKINALATQVEMPKKTIVFDTKQYEPKFYFIAKGSARVYIIDDEGNEVSYILFLEKDYLLSFDSYLYKKPSYEYIELLEDSVLFELNTEELKALYANDLELANLGRTMSDQFAHYTEQRFIDRLSLSATARYLKLIENYPEIIQRIPLKYIASYLGITQVSLSRIRAKI